jgi:serine/threonine-protein kinase HipA
MGRRRKARDLVVAMNGLPVATWTRSARGEQRFCYAPEWLARDAAIPVSLSMPLSSEPFQGAVVENFFDNLLPDNLDIRRRLQSRLGADSAQPFDLLAGIGGDCVGALQIHPADEVAPGVRSVEADALTDEEIADTLRNYRDRPLGIERGGDFRISIAGAQEKTALLWHHGRWCRPRGATPTSHILKLPIGPGAGGIDMTGSVENEWLCLRLVAAFGLPAAQAEMRAFADQRVLVVDRFDRRWSTDGSWLMRDHQEDFCQALGVSPGIKYESDGGPGVSRCFELLRATLDPEQDRRTFFRALVVYWLLAATDGHAKNFSLFLLPDGRCRMTPLYDVLSMYPIVARQQVSMRKVKMAMAALGKDRHYKWDHILRRHWRSTAQHVGLPLDDADAVLEDLLARGEGAIATVSAQLPASFPDGVAGPILEGVTDALKQLATG